MLIDCFNILQSNFESKQIKFVISKSIFKFITFKIDYILIPINFIYQVMNQKLV